MRTASAFLLLLLLLLCDGSRSDSVLATEAEEGSLCAEATDQRIRQLEEALSAVILHLTRRGGDVANTLNLDEWSNNFFDRHTKLEVYKRYTREVEAKRKADEEAEKRSKEQARISRFKAVLSECQCWVFSSKGEEDCYVSWLSQVGIDECCSTHNVSHINCNVDYVIPGEYSRYGLLPYDGRLMPARALKRPSL